MRKIGIMFFALVVMLPAISWAGEYVLEKGKGVEVCEVYKKNLESFNDPQPMMCERKINPEFKDFEKPVWEKVDLEEHRELFRRLLRYQGSDRNQFNQTTYDDNELNSYIKDQKQLGYPFVSSTKFSITPYKNWPSDILIYSAGACPYGPPFYASNLYILLEDPSVKDAMIDAANPLEKLLRTEISPNNGRDTVVDLFHYKGVPYIDKYCLSKQPGCTTKDTLIIYKYGSVRNPKTTSVLDKWKTGFHKICEYTYKNK